MTRRADHPTRLALIECAMRLADEHGLHGFTVETLLTQSGISKGSLYHHFEDFIDLLETIQVKQYALEIDRNIEQIRAVIVVTHSKDELRAAFYLVAENAHSAANRAARINRARMIGSTPGREKFARLLGEEQDRLRDAIAELIATAQAKGFVQRYAEPKALATFILAYSQGFMINDIAATPIDPRDYVEIVKHFVDSMVIT